MLRCIGPGKCNFSQLCRVCTTFTHSRLTLIRGIRMVGGFARQLWKIINVVHVKWIMTLVEGIYQVLVFL